MAELGIPLLALGGLYIASKKREERCENFTTGLPNTNIHDKNYPSEIVQNAQHDLTEKLSTVNKYDGQQAYTDKYFNQNMYEQKQRSGNTVGQNIQQVYSLTGDYMESGEFKHNNMVPFNGGKTQGQHYNNNNAETILDNYVGNGSQVIKKTEQAPLFKPQENIQWTFGAPDMSDFYQSRQNPVNKNNMVKPFESIQVGPGLDKGYGADGSHGYNAGMEARDKWLPKTVDELRVSTNPKQEYNLDGLEGPANSQIKNIGIEGKVEKHRPDTYFINTQDRWLTTTGAEKAGRVVAEEVQKVSHRNETTTFQHGTPNAVLKTASYVPTKHEQSKRTQLAGFGVGPSVSTSTAPLHNDKDNYHKSHSNYENNRSINQQPQTFGSGFSGAIGAVIAPVMDFLRPSKKDEYSCNMRVYGWVVWS